MYNWTEFF